MPQIVNGLILGAPGIAGSAPILILYGDTDPTDSTDPNAASCSVGSLFVDRVGGALWFKGLSGWQQISIP